MESNRFKFIVLHSFRYKESEVVIRGYSDKHGNCSLFLRSAQNSKRHNLSLLHPLSTLTVTPILRGRGEMIAVKEYEALHRLTTIREELKKSSIALFLAEIILKTIKEVEQNSALYNFLESSIVQLEQSKKGSANFHLWFLTHYLFYLGYSPTYSKQNSYGQVSEDGFHLLKGESELIDTFNGLTACNIDKVIISGKRRSQFLAAILHFLSFHQNYKIEVLALPILQEVFLY